MTGPFLLGADAGPVRRVTQSIVAAILRPESVTLQHLCVHTVSQILSGLGNNHPCNSAMKT